MSKKMPSNLFDQVTQRLQDTDRTPESTPEQAQKAGEAPEATEPLTGFTVRLPESQKAELERYLWERYGEKLAAGARRIITEWMREQGL